LTIAQEGLKAGIKSAKAAIRNGLEKARSGALKQSVKPSELGSHIKNRSARSSATQSPRTGKTSHKAKETYNGQKQGARQQAAKATKNSGKMVVRTTRSGDKGVRITKPDGSIIDITPKRVKEYVPNTHPKAPPGKLNRVKYDNPIPGTKGRKRLPTKNELRELKDAE